MGLTGVPSSYSVLPVSLDLPAKAATATINVSGSSGAWVALSNNDWIRITSGRSGTTSGSVQLSLADNTGRRRQGSIVVAEHRIVIDQAPDRVPRALPWRP